MKFEEPGGRGMVHRAHPPPMEAWSEGTENVAEEEMGQKYIWKGGDFTKFRLISLNLDNQINHPLMQTP